MVVGLFSSCSEDEMGDSIFDTTEKKLDPESFTFALDSFLQVNFLQPYNLRFQYKMEDISADMNYNLVPATYENSIDMAVLSKYLWYDVYKVVVSETFLKQNSPRIIHLIGSPAINANSGSETLGVTEGGLKITLYKVNSLDLNDIDMMNEKYFKTMHHEFAHILHQKKSYPVEYNLISTSQYEPYKWNDRNQNVSLSMGFITSYGGSEVQEDFVEVIANYIVSTDEVWNNLLDIASYGWETATKEPGKVEADLETIIDTQKDANTGKVISYTVLRKTIQRDEDDKPVVAKEDEEGNPIYTYLDPDGINGKEIIERKLNICRQWLQDSWGINLEELRKEVLKRQANINIDSLRNEVEKLKPVK